MAEHSQTKCKKKKVVTVKRLKNLMLTLVGLSVIFLAMSFTLIRVAIKSIPDYSEAIQQAVSKQMDMTLEVALIDAEIYWLVPRLNLFDVNVFDKTGEHHLLHLDEIDLSLDWAQTIKTMTPVVGEITLVALSVELKIDKNSQLSIQDYIVNKNIGAALNTVNEAELRKEFKISEAFKHNFNNLNFKILNSEIEFSDERYTKNNVIFTNLNVHIINSDRSHVFEIKANLPKKYGKYVHFIADIDGDLFDYKNLQGELFLSVENIIAASWLDDYRSEFGISADADISGDIWLDWKGQKITNLNSRIDVSGFALHYLDKNVKTWSINRLQLSSGWSKNKNDWQLDVRDMVVDRDGVDWPKAAAYTLKMNHSENEIQLQADFMRIDGLAYLAGMVNSVVDLDIVWMDLLKKYNPSGGLKNLDIKLPIDTPQNIKINTEFSQLGFSLPGTEPDKIVNLQGSVKYLDKKTRLILDSKNTEIIFKDLFRKSINLKLLKGELELTHQNYVWGLSTDSLLINTPHIETELRLDFNMPDNGRAFLDLTTRFKNGDGKAVGTYLPAGIMGKDAVSWIDRAINQGEITDGGYLFYGYLGDAPFREAQGVSLADFNVKNVDLTYLENWPEISGISANLRFENDTMLIKAHHGHLYDSKIGETTVYIDNFISPTLDVKGRVNANLHDLKLFINESSLHEGVTDYIDNLLFEGKGVLDLELFLPLYGDYYTEVGGQLMIETGRMKFIKEKYELTNIGGLLQFVGGIIESKNLKTEIAGGLPGQLIDVEIKTNSNQFERTYDITAKGEVLASSLLAPLPGYQGYFNGSANWDVGIDIINNKISHETSVKVNVQSDLQGVISTFPGPLTKSLSGASPINIDINVKPDSTVKYNISLNNGDKLELLNTKDKLYLNADAESVKGRMMVNMNDDIDVPIDVKLDYMDLNKFFNTDKGNAAIVLTNNENELFENKAITMEYPQAAPVQPVSPRKVPSFNFFAKKLVWKKSVYSDSTINVQESKLGAVIKGFTLNGGDHLVTGKGSWFIGRHNQDFTKLDVNIKIDDLGSVLKDLEMSDDLVSTSGNIRLRWEWQGAPYSFDWKSLQGDGELSLKKGTLKNLNAGAGRLLGLFNFETLLSLDFGSQVKEGFNFDKVKGSFSFSNGNIYSDDFEIESKMADIKMKGQLNVINSTVKQTITVRPHVGSTVTLGAAVVAGPTIAGMVFLFQKIFDTDRLAEYQYTMRGSVDEPVVELISSPPLDEDDDSEF
jgi:uncharacterized protein YhdP